MSEPLSPITRRGALRGLAMTATLGLGGCADDLIAYGSFLGFTPAGADGAMLDRVTAPLVETLGGEYENPPLRTFLMSLLGRLAAAAGADRDALAITLLEDDRPNIFTTPDGTIYITRGMLALPNNEAQMASLMALELALVIDGHATRRFDTAFATSRNVALLERLVPGSRLDRSLDFVAAPYLTPYSAESIAAAEQRAADLLAATGYDPGAGIAMQSTVEGQARFEVRRRDLPVVDPFSFAATHPRSPSVLAQAVNLARAEAAEFQVAEEAPFLQRIDTLPYGPRPENGMVVDGRYAHPVHGYGFDLPDGFHLFPGPRRVVGRAIGDVTFAVDVNREVGPRPHIYLRDVWARTLRLFAVEALEINGMAAGTGRARMDTEKGPMDLRFVVYRLDRDRFARMVFVSPGGLTREVSAILKRVAFSFRAEPAALPTVGRQIRVLRVQRGNTLDGLASAMEGSDDPAAELRAINGIQPGGQLEPGQLLKVITNLTA